MERRGAERDAEKEGRRTQRSTAHTTQQLLAPNKQASKQEMFEDGDEKGEGLPRRKERGLPLSPCSCATPITLDTLGGSPNFGSQHGRADTRQQAYEAGGGHSLHAIKGWARQEQGQGRMVGGGCIE